MCTTATTTLAASTEYQIPLTSDFKIPFSNIGSISNLSNKAQEKSMRVYWTSHTVSVEHDKMNPSWNDFPQSIKYEVGNPNDIGFIEGTLYLESYAKMPNTYNTWNVTYSGYVTYWE